jgi:crotonobetainyl-CoA:carnitine CoA-transferase CaiB-like acyl-CoA transferase
MIVDVETPTFGNVKMIGSPIKVSNDEPEYKAGPSLGQHNQEVYGEILGYDSDYIDQLKNNKII